MSIVTGICLFVMVWWTVLFLVLPFGVKTAERPEPGMAESAPVRPRILLKFAVTTVISVLVGGGIFAVTQSDLISFREMAKTM